MPIRRWHGWGAWCRRCRQWVDLGEGQEAYAQRADVKDTLGLTRGDSVEAAIQAACGCARRAQAKEGIPHG